MIPGLLNPDFIIFRLNLPLNNSMWLDNIREFVGFNDFPQYTFLEYRITYSYSAEKI